MLLKRTIGMIEPTYLTPPALDWIREAVGTGTQIVSAIRMAGTTSSTLHRVVAERAGSRLDLVLRLYTNAEWLAEEPRVAAHEASNLQKMRESGVPAPELIGYDPDGSRMGVPAVLMTAVPGTVALQPVDFDDWLDQQAQVLPSIHAVSADDYPWQYNPYNDVTKLEVPNWSRHLRLWERAIELANGPWPARRECFIHRDYHPTNVLWQGNQLSGVVDWPNACRGPAGIDVSWSRMNLAFLYGVEMAERFLRRFEMVTGNEGDYHPFWDLMVMIEMLPGPPGGYTPWVEYGMQGLTDHLMLERGEEYLVSVMRRLGE